MFLLALLVFGMFCGWVAQLILGQGSRPDARSLVAGVVGSFVGGLLSSVIFEKDFRPHPSGFIGSIVGAIIVLLIWTAIDKRRANAR